MQSADSRPFPLAVSRKNRADETTRPDEKHSPSISCPLYRSPHPRAVPLFPGDPTKGTGRGPPRPPKRRSPPRSLLFSAGKGGASRSGVVSCNSSASLAGEPKACSNAAIGGGGVLFQQRAQRLPEGLLDPLPPAEPGHPAPQLPLVAEKITVVHGHPLPAKWLPPLQKRGGRYAADPEDRRAPLP